MLKNKIIIPVLMFLVCLSVNAQWLEQTNPAVKKQNSVFFLNSQTGFTGGDTGTMQRSTNSGITWFSSNLGISGNVNVSDINFSVIVTGYSTATNDS